MNIFTPRKQIKLIILGDENVGKTTIISKYTNFDYLNTINFEFSSKIIQNSDYEIKVNIWDVKGHIAFNKMCNSYIKDSNAFVIVYDITNPKTFYNIPFWINKIKENNQHVFNNNYYPILLIGNKYDNENRKIYYEEAKKFALYNELLYCELSKDNIDKINSVLDIYLNFVYDIDNIKENQDFNYQNIFFLQCEKKENKLPLTKSIENLNLLNNQYKNKSCKNCQNICEIL